MIRGRRRARRGARRARLRVRARGTPAPIRPTGPQVRRRTPQPDRTSASLERIRDLTEKLPVMVAPKWPRSRTQSIAVRGAEVKLPGEAWLGFEIERGADARPVLRPTAAFRPRGLAGRAYRMVVTPVHALVFGGLLRGLVDSGMRPRRGFLRGIDTDVPRDPDR